MKRTLLNLILTWRVFSLWSPSSSRCWRCSQIMNDDSWYTKLGKIWFISAIWIYRKMSFTKKFSAQTFTFLSLRVSIAIHILLCFILNGNRRIFLLICIAFLSSKLPRVYFVRFDTFLWKIAFSSKWQKELSKYVLQVSILVCIHIMIILEKGEMSLFMPIGSLKLRISLTTPVWFHFENVVKFTETVWIEIPMMEVNGDSQSSHQGTGITTITGLIKILIGWRNSMHRILKNYNRGAGIIRQHTIDLYLVNGNVTADIYLNLLCYNTVTWSLFSNEDRPGMPNHNVWFQKDCAALC